jgi:1-deoxy-D-xylulose-5-phosphate synthase
MQMPSILERVHSPADIKGLSSQELGQLAQEARRLIIETVNRNGGHMASNLGVVELTIALHRVFNSPEDSLVFDTTNQCYTHKLLTGRFDRFPTLRTPGGLSGFCEPAESPHDVMAAGHAGTGLSIALGLALSRSLQQAEDRYVACVVGDGALTSGMCYEALNNIAQLRPKNLIVILNDNGMSISDNVGWLTRWRDRVSLHPEYQAMVQRAKKAIQKMPKGELAWKLVKRAKDSIQGFIIPNLIWEEMGFKYIGPVDGHDFKALETALTLAQNSMEKPPFIHVITHKGRGYTPAEDDPVKFHQPGSPLGSSAAGAPTYSSVFARTVTHLMEQDPRVVGISAAMLEGTALVEAQKKFPDRVFDVGVAEEHAVTMAAGMAKGGLKPFVAIYSTFLQRGFDQVLHDVGLNTFPVVLAVDRAGLVGEDGKSHQGIFDIAYLRCIPNVIVAAPKDEDELQHLLYTAYLSPQPMAVRYPRGSGLGVPLSQELHEVPIGKGELLRQGKDGALVALGSMVSVSLKAAEILSKEGIECAVVNARFVKPLDMELLLSLCSKGLGLVTVEEHLLMGGFGSAVAEGLASHLLGQNLLGCIGLPDEFIEHSPRSLLLRRYGLTPEGVAARVKEMLNARRASEGGAIAKVVAPLPS